MRSHSMKGRCLIALAILLIAGAAHAQDARGSITGRVVDSSGGVLPGVSVAVTNTGTNGTTTVVTNDSGLYTALYLTPGSYTVTATLSGFKKATHGDINVRVG